MEGGESHLDGVLHKNPLNNGGQKIGGRTSPTGWWWGRVKPQNDSVLRFGVPPAGRSTFGSRSGEPAVFPPRATLATFNRAPPRPTNETRVSLAPTSRWSDPPIQPNLAPVEQCPRDNDITHGVTRQPSILRNLLPDQVLAPGLPFAETASKLYFNHDDPLV